MPGSEEEDDLAGCGFSISVPCVAALGSVEGLPLCVYVCFIYFVLSSFPVCADPAVSRGVLERADLCLSR